MVKIFPFIRQKYFYLTLAVTFTAITAGVAVVSLPLYWITFVLGVMVFLFVLLRPFEGVILLLALLYLPVLPTVPMGPVTMSVTSIPIAALAVAAFFRLRDGFSKIDRWQIATLLIVFTAFLAAVLFSTSPQQSALLLPNLLLYLLLLFALPILIQSYDQLLTIAKAIVFLGIVLAIWKEIDGVFNLPRVQLNTNGINFQHNPTLAICLVGAILPTSLYGKKRGWILWLSLVIVVVDMIYFQTRAFWIAGIALLILTITQIKISNRLALTLLFTTIILITIVFAFSGIIFQNINQTRNTIDAMRSGDTQELSPDDMIRLVARNASIKIIEERPVLGWGLNLYSAIKPTFAVGTLKSTEGGSYNSWLLLLSEMGIAGAGIIGGLFILPFLIIWKRLHANMSKVNYLAFAFALGVIGLSIHLFFIDLIYGSFTWFHLGLALAAVKISSVSGK